MKLWQKVFLSTLLLVMVAIHVVSWVLVRNSQELMLEREQSRCLESHENLSANIANRVIYQRLRLNKIVLDEENVLEQIEMSLSASGSNTFGAAVYRDGEELSHAGVTISPLNLPEGFIQENMCALRPVSSDNHHYLLTASFIFVEGQQMELYTISDISEIYTLREKQVVFIQRMGLLLSCCCAVLLLLWTIPLLAPLRRLNQLTQKIAAGQYSVRVPERGSAEFRELAHSMNVMADAVEANVEQLEQVAEDRKRFIANLAHEMKTPLTSILGFADILRISRTVSDDQRQEYAGIIVEEAKRLRTLSGKLMELITMGSTALTLTTVTIPDIFAEIELTLRPNVLAHECKLYVIPSRVSILCDVTLIKSMLFNLLDNALKATAKGGHILLYCKYNQEKEEIRITVRDNGIGMSEETVQKATEPFFMADKARTRCAGGAGLGLALCAEIARVHGGQLQIKSQLGKGTMIQVTLPVKPPESTNRLSTPPQGGSTHA